MDLLSSPFYHPSCPASRWKVGRGGTRYPVATFAKETPTSPRRVLPSRQRLVSQPPWRFLSFFFFFFFSFLLQTPGCFARFCRSARKQLSVIHPPVPTISSSMRPLRTKRGGAQLIGWHDSNGTRVPSFNDIR